MLLGKIANMEINVIIVDIATREANIIVQLIEKFAVNVVERTTSKLCADPVRDQRLNQSISHEKGQIGPVENVCTDAMCMKLWKTVMMTTTWMAWLTRSSHCFITRNLYI